MNNNRTCYAVGVGGGVNVWGGDAVEKSPAYGKDESHKAKDQIEEAKALSLKMADLVEGYPIAVAMQALKALQYALSRKAMEDFAKMAMDDFSKR